MATVKQLEVNPNRKGPAAAVEVNGPITILCINCNGYKLVRGYIVRSPSHLGMSFEYIGADGWVKQVSEFLNKRANRYGLLVVFPLSNVSEIRNKWAELKKSDDGQDLSLVQRDVWEFETLVIPVSEAFLIGRLFDAGNIEFYIIGEIYYRIWNLGNAAQMIQDPKGKMMGILNNALREFIKTQAIYQAMIDADSPTSATSNTAEQSSQAESVTASTESGQAEDWREKLSEMFFRYLKGLQSGEQESAEYDVPPEDDDGAGATDLVTTDVDKPPEDDDGAGATDLVTTDVDKMGRKSPFDQIKTIAYLPISVVFYVVEPKDPKLKELLRAKRVNSLQGEANIEAERMALKALQIKLTGLRKMGRTYRDPNVMKAAITQAIVEFVHSDQIQQGGINSMMFSRYVWDIAGGMLSKQEVDDALSGKIEPQRIGGSRWGKKRGMRRQTEEQAEE